MKAVARRVPAILVLTVGLARIASACPTCQLGASALVGAYDADPRACRSNAAPSTQPATEPFDSGRAEDQDGHAPLPFGLTVTGGADFTTAYFHRGYIMDDRGFIAQPYLNLAVPVVSREDFSITPYVGGWVDIQSGGTHNSGVKNGTAVSGGAIAPMPCCADDLVSAKSAPRRIRASAATAAAGSSGYDVYETDLTAGVAIDRGPLFADLRYKIYTFPGGALSDYQEIGAKLSYDVASFWRPVSESGGFLLRPFVEFDHQIEGAARRKYDYLETGIEPSFTLPLGRTRVGFSLPVDIGMSINNYYTASNGSNQTLGYYSAALKASIPLPVSPRFGSWYLTGTVTYLRLNADNLKVLNHNKADEVIGTLGISFAY